MNELYSPIRGKKLMLTNPNVHDCTVTVDPDRNTVSWTHSQSARSDYQVMPTCFGKLVGISDKPRPDHAAIIFFEKAVYAMDYIGSAMFTFTPLITA